MTRYLNRTANLSFVPEKESIKCSYFQNDLQEATIKSALSSFPDSWELQLKPPAFLSPSYRLGTPLLLQTRGQRSTVGKKPLETNYSKGAQNPLCSLKGSPALQAN